MRILHVVPSYIPAFRYGGPIRSVHGLCRALAARGHEVEVATTNVDGPGDSRVPLGTAVDLDGVKVFYFESPRLRRLYYAPAMYGFMKANMPRWDLVHTHSVFLWPTSAAAHLARTARRPYVVSPRGMLVADLIDRRSSLAKRAWIRFFERRNLEQAGAVHVTSEIERRELLALRISPRRLFEIPNGVDLHQRAIQDPGASGGPVRRYVLFLGRISWKKGLDRLISAMTHVPDADLVVAGPDDEDLWPALARQAAELGLTERVHRMEFVEGEEKRRLLARATAFALPSHSENFGNAVLESMAEGVPVVVTPEVGIAPYVQASGSGLVASGDPGEFGGALHRLVEDRALRDRLAANCRDAAMAYSWDAIGARMEAEYSRLSG